MAGLCRISSKQLQRVFREAFHRTPTEWIREFRSRLTIELLAKGYRNKEVAAELHYASETHLCHDFRKVYRDSPQNFVHTLAKSRKKGIAPVSRAMSLMSNDFELHSKQYGSKEKAKSWPFNLYV